MWGKRGREKKAFRLSHAAVPRREKKRERNKSLKERRRSNASPLHTHTSLPFTSPLCIFLIYLSAHSVEVSDPRLMFYHNERSSEWMSKKREREKQALFCDDMGVDGIILFLF